MELGNLSVQNLTGIEALDRSDILTIFRAADTVRAAYEEDPRRVGSLLSGRTVVNLFVEDSTRTRNSFHLAALRLGASVLNVTGSGSSFSKGETLLDTLRVLEAMGVDAVVLRHHRAGAPHYLAAHAASVVINAGDGRHEHPTQALLDGYTLYREWGESALPGKTIGIVGDITHGRVALSNIFSFLRLGAEVVLCAPPTLMPRGVEALGVTVVSTLDELLERVDAVIMLRMQLERQNRAFVPSLAEYTRLYGLTSARLAAVGKPDLPVLHPGPVNRGVEVSPEIADGPNSRILEQVANGLHVRTAILQLLLGSENR